MYRSVDCGCTMRSPSDSATFQPIPAAESLRKTQSRHTCCPAEPNSFARLTSLIPSQHLHGSSWSLHQTATSLIVFSLVPSPDSRTSLRSTLAAADQFLPKIERQCIIPNDLCPLSELNTKIRPNASMQEHYRLALAIQYDVLRQIQLFAQQIRLRWACLLILVAQHISIQARSIRHLLNQNGMSKNVLLPGPH